MSDPSPRATGWARWRAPLLVAVVLTGALLRFVLADHHHLVDYDEGRYLDNAVNVLRGRGLETHYTSHFFRPPEQTPPIHPEDISAPLYPWLLAVTFAATGAELRPAQLWSLVPGCLLIWLTFALGRRLFDERSALLASVLVALNPDMAILSSWAMTESLYAAALLAILLLADRPAPWGSEPVKWAALGGACGLLYLLRPNGLGVAAAIGLTALLPRPIEPSAPAKARWTRRLTAAACFGLCFLACIAPWLARNQREFGSPTYTAMKNVAWSESGRDLFTREGPPPSLRTFRQRHGDAALVRNMAHRGARAVGYLLWGDTGAFNLLCLLYPIALALTWRVPTLRAGHLCVLFSTLLLAGVPLWTGALSRYLLPLRPWIYLTVIGAAVQGVPQVAWRRNLRREKGGGEVALSTEPARRTTLAMAATLVALIGVGAVAPLREAIDRQEVDADRVAREAAVWIAGHTPEDAVLMEGARIHQYVFLFDRAVVWTPAGGLDELLRAARDYHAGYLVVSAELIRFRPELAPHFSVTDGAVRAVALPEGFTEVFAGAGRRVVIYRLPAASA